MKKKLITKWFSISRKEKVWWCENTADEKWRTNTHRRMLIGMQLIFDFYYFENTTPMIRVSVVHW